MFEKIEELERRFQELESLLSDPAVIGNQPEFRKLSREHAELAELVAAYRRYKKVLTEIEGNRELLADPDMKAMAEEVQTSVARVAAEADIPAEVARYLAAHSPTMRAQGQTFQIAQRLSRGEHLFEE